LPYNGPTLKRKSKTSKEITPNVQNLRSLTSSQVSVLQKGKLFRRKTQSLLKAKQDNQKSKIPNEKTTMIKKYFK